MHTPDGPRTDGISSEELIAALRGADAYPVPCQSPVVMHETHVSWVFLVGDFAYKLKKPIRTSFLDYSTLSRREHFCHEELRLDRRYAEDLYLSVVPITIQEDHIRVEGQGVPIEFAVKMRRFPDDALLSQRLEEGRLSNNDVLQVAEVVADFHASAVPSDTSSAFGSPDAAGRDLTDCLDDLRASVFADELSSSLENLERWESDFFSTHQSLFSQRQQQGFIRECHGDLHLANVIDWRGRLMPFDGIEFNDAFRWIDVLSDAAFLAMDLAARGRLDLCRSFINAYLQRTGDYQSLPLLRWYLVYRALVRAKVAALRAAQSDDGRTDAQEDCTSHVRLAEHFTGSQQPRLWITHGLSGSGKTTNSEVLVTRLGAIRVRSDVERKRQFGLSSTQRADPATRAEMYAAAANRATYARLEELATGILRAGYPVIVDATFLKLDQRDTFRRLAAKEGVRFSILDCQADEATLRQRIADRLRDDHDASDADLAVLDLQLASQQPLTEAEQRDVVDVESDTTG